MRFSPRGLGHGQSGCATYHPSTVIWCAQTTVSSPHAVAEATSRFFTAKRQSPIRAAYCDSSPSNRCTVDAWCIYACTR